jgi:hypothetical protein
MALGLCRTGHSLASFFPSVDVFGDDCASAPRQAQSEDMARMFEWFDTTGYAAGIERLRRDFPEVRWHRFEEWAREQDWSVLDQS